MMKQMKKVKNYQLQIIMKHFTLTEMFLKKARHLPKQVKNNGNRKVGRAHIQLKKM
ncbi:MAG: hypothetical protein JSW06_03680 [Thermoplasmatales archaeon]|nr:MAG: hypothetical protein JSW06_03680 [Thermoplasmatales archaeon]